MILVWCVGVAGGDDGLDGPKFTGTIPEPPSQGEPWVSPDSKVPKFVVNASTFLFDQGLADPRECEYRQVVVTVGSAWGGGGAETPRRGWVLPATGKTDSRFAVLWDGLVYPLVRVGDPADLDLDVALMVKTGQLAPETSARARYRQPKDTNPGRDLDPLSPIEVGLLLRLGRADLAESVWTALEKLTPLNQRNRGGVGSGPPPSSYTYLTMARDLAWSHFERAVIALKRGDDGVVLHDSRVLTRLQAGVEAKAAYLGFIRPNDVMNHQARPYIEFLGQLPQLLADAERRAGESPRPPIPAPGGPDKAARITALINDLDQIRADQWGQPGGVSLGSAPTVQALIAQGDDAVEPLIAVLRTDHRLTRSFSFHRDFFRSRTLLYVQDAAYAALSGILHTTSFAAGSTGDNLSARGDSTRQEVADRIEAYWNRYKAFPLVERWYQTLANDQANPNAWVEAVGNITEAGNVTVVPGSSVFTETMTSELKPGEKPRMRGESLREGHDPAVTQLIIRRADAVDNSLLASSLADGLVAWDRAASLPTLKKVAKQIEAQVASGREKTAWVLANEMTTFADFAVERIELGDPDAARDYAALIRTIPPETFEQNLLAPLKPFYRLPDEPILREAAETLFNDPASPWANLFRPGRKFSFDKQLELVRSPLVRVPGFRRALLTALGDATELGTVEADAQGGVKFQFKSGGQGGISGHRVDPLTPPPGTTLPYRVADQVADQLTHLDGACDFQSYWPLANRAAAIAQLHVFLDRFGPRFTPDKPANDRSFDPNKTAYLVYPSLDHPATLAEVAEGRAIFSTEASAGAPPIERRVVPLMDRPLAATWTTLRDFPVRVPTQVAGKPVEKVEYENSGQVWQAEEVLEAGVWKRYFGFVGAHRVARVPAEEIDFGDRYGWIGRSSPNGWDVIFNLTGPNWTSHPFPSLVVDDSAKVCATLQLKNRRGHDQSLPTDLVQTRDDQTIALERGLTIQLDRADLLPPDPTNSFDDFEHATWSAIPLKPTIARFDSTRPRVSLRPHRKEPDLASQPHRPLRRQRTGVLSTHDPIRPRFPPRPSRRSKPICNLLLSNHPPDHPILDAE